MNKRQIFTTVLSVLVSVFLVAGAVYAVTTLSTNIVTQGDLQVDGNTALNDTVVTGSTTITDTVVDSPAGIPINVGSALIVRSTLTSGDSSERGIAGRFVSKIVGPIDDTINSGLSVFTYVYGNDVTMAGGANLYGLFVGVEEDDEPGEGQNIDAVLTGGIAAGISIYTEFKSATAPSVYPFYINADPSGHGVDALIYAPGDHAIGLVQGDAGTATDAYIMIDVANVIYRIPLVKIMP